jgi:hypothetical protein
MSTVQIFQNEWKNLNKLWWMKATSPSIHQTCLNPIKDTATIRDLSQKNRECLWEPQYEKNCYKVQLRGVDWNWWPMLSWISLLITSSLKFKNSI